MFSDIGLRNTICCYILCCDELNCMISGGIFLDEQFCAFYGNEIVFVTFCVFSRRDEENRANVKETIQLMEESFDEM